MFVGLFIIGMILWGAAIGWVGQLLLGGGKIRGNDWMQAVVAGVLGSVVGGTAVSLLMGEGLTLRFGGIIGSIAGAVVVLLIWRAIAGRKS